MLIVQGRLFLEELQARMLVADANESIDLRFLIPPSQWQAGQRAFFRQIRRLANIKGYSFTDAEMLKKEIILYDICVLFITITEYEVVRPALTVSMNLL